jgi:hypothetical protein
VYLAHTHGTEQKKLAESRFLSGNEKPQPRNTTETVNTVNTNPACLVPVSSIARPNLLAFLAIIITLAYLLSSGCAGYEALAL